MSNVLGLLIALGAMLATTVVRRSTLVRELRLLRSSEPDPKKKRKQREGSDGASSLFDNVSWPDSDNDSDSGGQGGASD